MDEKKVATKQERLQFEKLIQNDRQYPTQRRNQGSGGREVTPMTAAQGQRSNLEQGQVQTHETPRPQQGNAPVLQQRPLIKRNIGKRDAVWEEKRKRKMEMVEYYTQREQQFSDKQFREEYKLETPPNGNQRTPVKRGAEQEVNQPRKTPIAQEYNQPPQRTPINKDGYTLQQQPPQQQMQRETPMAQNGYGKQPERTPMPNPQYKPNPITNQPQSQTPINPNYSRGNYDQMKGTTPMQQYEERRTPINQESLPQQQQRRTPLNQDYYQQPNRTPMQPYSQTMPNRTPLNNEYNNRPGYSYEQVQQPPINRTPLTTNQEAYRGGYSNQTNAQRVTPYNQPPNRTPYNYQQGNASYSQPQSRTPYNQLQQTYPQPTPSKANQMGYSQRPPQYYEQENFNRNNQQYASSTPQQYPGNAYPHQRTPQYPHDQMPPNQMRGSRTPFTDAQGNPSYKPSGSFYAQQGGNPNGVSIPNRPPSRPFDNVSFKDQPQAGPQYYPNKQQPYY